MFLPRHCTACAADPAGQLGWVDAQRAAIRRTRLRGKFLFDRWCIMALSGWPGSAVAMALPEWRGCKSELRDREQS
jgi:hypothetical protein